MYTMNGDRGFRHKTLSESSGCSSASEMLCPHPPPPHYPPHATHPPPPLPPSIASPHLELPSPGGASPTRPSSCTRFCESVYLLPTRVATVLLALLQGGILDCYLTHYNSKYWFAWIAGDVAVLMMFVVAFVISYRQLTLVMRRLQRGACTTLPPTPLPDAAGGGRGRCCVGGLAMLGLEPLDKEGEGGELVSSAGSMPLVYFAWLVYSAVLAIRVLLIYKNFAHELSDDVFLGKNMLQMTVAASSIVFLLLLFAHHDASPDSRRRHRIDTLTYLVIFDIVDATDLVSVLASPSARVAMETWVTWCVLGVACLNLVLPTLPLMALSRTQFGARPLPEYLQTLRRLLVLVGVNLPLLATRLLLWQQLQLPVSSFLMKNMAVCFVMLYSFYERDHHQRLRDRLLQSQHMLG